jgi:hypothetical protein
VEHVCEKLEIYKKDLPVPLALEKSYLERELIYLEKLNENKTDVSRLL